MKTLTLKTYLTAQAAVITASLAEVSPTDYGQATIEWVSKYAALYRKIWDVSTNYTKLSRPDGITVKGYVSEVERKQK